MAKRAGVLELAVLGLLHESPLHGYELRKRLNALLGSFRAFSYGSLYPCLKQLLARGLDRRGHRRPSTRRPARASARASSTSSRPRARSTSQDLLAESGPSAWEDEGFGVHFAFFGRTDAATRLRILEGRRSRLEERVDGFRTALSRTRERLDSYTLELQRHGLESVEREVRWLTELIDDERRRDAPASPATTPHDTPARTASAPPAVSPQ